MGRIVIAPGELNRLGGVYNLIGRDVGAVGNRLIRDTGSARLNSADPGFSPAAFQQRVNAARFELRRLNREYEVDADLMTRTAQEGRDADVSTLADGGIIALGRPVWAYNGSPTSAAVRAIEFGAAVDANPWWQRVDKSDYFREVAMASPTIANVLRLDRAARSVRSGASARWATLPGHLRRSASATNRFGLNSSFGSLGQANRIRFGALARFGPASRFARNYPWAAGASRALANSFANANVMRGRATWSLTATLARRQREAASALRMSELRAGRYARTANRFAGRTASRFTSTAGRFATRFPTASGRLATVGRFAKPFGRVLGVAGVAFDGASAANSFMKGDVEGGLVSSAKVVGGIMMIAGGPVTMTAGALIIGGAMIWEAHGDTIKRATADAARWADKKLNEARDAVANKVVDVAEDVVEVVTDPVGSVKKLFGWGS